MIRSDGMNSQQYRAKVSRDAGTTVFREVGERYGGYAKGVQNGPAPTRKARDKSKKGHGK